MDSITAIKAFASRGLRRGTAAQLALYSGGIALLLVLASIWWVGHADGPPGGDSSYLSEYMHEQIPQMAWSVLALADVLAVMALGLGLFVVAPATVVAQVVAERRAGTLDQLRTTPIPPLGLVLGILVGGPARVYLLLIGPLALHVAAGLGGAIHLDTLVTTLLVFAAGGAASLTLALAAALAPRQEAGGGLLAVVVALVLGVLCVMAFVLPGERLPAGWAFVHPASAIDAALLEHDGIWRRLFHSLWDWSAFRDARYVDRLGFAPIGSLLCSLVTTGLVGAACCRKLARPHLPLLGKKMAIVAFTAVASAMLLPLIGERAEQTHPGGVIAACAMMLLLGMALLTALATPTAEAWAMGVRRIQKPSLLSDDASPRLAGYLMIAVFAALALIVSLATAPLGFEMRSTEIIATLWCGVLALGVPSLVLFLGTRWSTPAARWGFGSAIVAYLIAELIAVIMVADRERNFGSAYVQAMAIVAVAVPVWVAVRQRALRQRTVNVKEASHDVKEIALA